MHCKIQLLRILSCEIPRLGRLRTVSTTLKQNILIDVRKIKLSHIFNKMRVCTVNIFVILHKFVERIFTLKLPERQEAICSGQALSEI